MTPLRSTRREPLLMHNTVRITEGDLEGFAQSIDRAVEFVEEHWPQIMVQVVGRLEMYGESDETMTEGLPPDSTDRVDFSAVPRPTGFLRTPETAS